MICWVNISIHHNAEINNRPSQQTVWRSNSHALAVTPTLSKESSCEACIRLWNLWKEGDNGPTNCHCINTDRQAKAEAEGCVLRLQLFVSEHFNNNISPSGPWINYSSGRKSACRYFPTGLPYLSREWYHAWPMLLLLSVFIRTVPTWEMME